MTEMANTTKFMVAEAGHMNLDKEVRFGPHLMKDHQVFQLKMATRNQ